MLYDPRDLAQGLEDQGNTVHPDRGEVGNPIYRITLPDGTHCTLSADDMYELKNQGKVNAAGILERDAKIKRQKTKAEATIEPDLRRTGASSLFTSDVESIV
jgi:hypothetical protein